MHIFFKECANKKHKIGTAQDLEVAYFSDANNSFTTIVNETHDALHNNSHEGNTSILQDAEEVEEMKINANSTTNVTISDDFLENNSSQESQYGKKSLIITS